MNGSKTLKEVFVGTLAGLSICSILLGIEAIATKGNGIMFMGCGVLLFLGTLVIAKTIKVFWAQ